MASYGDVNTVQGLQKGSKHKLYLNNPFPTSRRTNCISFVETILDRETPQRGLFWESYGTYAVRKRHIFNITLKNCNLFFISSVKGQTSFFFPSTPHFCHHQIKININSNSIRPLLETTTIPLLFCLNGDVINNTKSQLLGRVTLRCSYFLCHGSRGGRTLSFLCARAAVDTATHLTILGSRFL